MRKIKFRGKAIRGGDFVYGDFIHDNNGNRLLIRNPKTKNPRIVYPESVAQFVGYDADGKEVYEGDICEFEGKHKFVVKWDDTEMKFVMFRLDGTKSPVQFHGEAYQNLKIVGNIYCEDYI